MGPNPSPSRNDPQLDEKLAYNNNNKGSAHHHICGDYDFSRNPIAPLGTRVIILEDPNKRGSWASHGVRGFYVGPALDHYRSFRVLIDDTKRVRITDSVSWHPRDEHNFADIRSQMQSSIVKETLNEHEAAWPAQSGQVDPKVPLSVPTSHPLPPYTSPSSQVTSVSVTSSPESDPEESLPGTDHATPTEAEIRELPSPMEQSQATTVESMSQVTITSSESQASSSEFHTQESSSARSPRRASRRKHKPNIKGCSNSREWQNHTSLHARDLTRTGGYWRRMRSLTG
jgi:hypothetical protein